MSSTYRTTCPSCGNNNYVVWIDTSRGTYCYNCGHTEKVSSAPIKEIKRSNRIPEIRAYYKHLAGLYHSYLTDEHRTYLYRRGVSEYSITKHKIGFCPDTELLDYRADIAIEAGIYYKGNITHKGRITFPFFAEGEVTDLWSRAYSKDDEVKYKGCFGSAYRRGADYMYCHDYAYKPNAHTRLVRTEGLIKALVSNQYGIACVAYPGTTAYRSGTPPMLGQKQIILFDNQLKARRELKQTIIKEAERYQNPYVAVLPLRGGSKSDIDEYIFRYGIEDYIRVVDGALPFEEWKQLVK